MLMTANPCADAERWANEQDRRAFTAEALEIEAGQMVLAVLAEAKPTTWHTAVGLGSNNWSPDELLVEALDCDDETISAFAELMTSPAAQKVREAIAAHRAKAYWRDIVGDKADGV